MGYTTTFSGSLTFNKRLDPKLIDYINRFAEIRHMDRNPDIIKTIDPNWEKHCFNGNLGTHGEHYCPPDKIPESWFKPRKTEKAIPSSTGKQPIQAAEKTYNNTFGDMPDMSVLNYNMPAPGVPGLWCQWIIDDNGELTWDEGEKFYSYVEWLQFLIDNYFAPSDYVLNGIISWQGEESDDIGTIIVNDNQITTVNG